ncbi:MAG TPA: circadian clock KaiB family protein [Terriglobales bacterium]|nr:circadian clock KaiB family protein [Terriglobales bacterium]
MADAIEPSSQAGSQPAARFVLRLFVAGATEQSKNAICNVRNVCEQHLTDRYELEIIDVFQTPVLAVSENIVATPTLVLPPPLRRVIGNLSHERVMVGMQLLDLNPETGHE